MVKILVALVALVAYIHHTTKQVGVAMISWRFHSIGFWVSTPWFRVVVVNREKQERTYQTKAQIADGRVVEHMIGKFGVRFINEKQKYRR